MANRSRGILQRISIVLLSIAVLLLMLVELLGGALKALLPPDLEAFLKRQHRFVAYGVVGVALVGYVALHFAEYAAFWWGFTFVGIVLMILSKVYFVSVLGYLCRVYSDRLLAVGWVRRSWEWYVSAKEYMHSFAWYRYASRIFHRMKDRAKTLHQMYRDKLKGRSLFSVLRRVFRRQRSRYCK